MSLQATLVLHPFQLHVQPIFWKILKKTLGVEKQFDQLQGAVSEVTRKKFCCQKFH